MNKLLPLVAGVLFLSSCAKQELSNNESAEAAAKQKAGSNVAAKQESITFSQISSTIVPGGSAAAEISAYDPSTKKLFTVNNSAGNNRIDVYDFSNPASPVALPFINTSIYGGFVNSVYVSNGKLAAAVEAVPKTNPGKVLVFNTSDYSLIANVTVGALPDMVTFSPDGKYILTANEGEPNDAYTIDPIGSVSIISVEENYAVTTLDFSGFASRVNELKAKGFRIFGKNASFAQDIEPEYIAVSENSKKAWVTLQENNGMALIDLDSKTIENIFPFGFKDYNADGNTIDASDQPSATPPIVDFKNWPVKGIYLPDAIAVMPNNNVPFVFTANEGDARAYTGFNEERRLGSAAHVFDPTVFPNAATLKLPANLGRLLSTTTLGDTDGDGDYDELYSYGARSFSIWHGLTGELIFDSKDIIDKTAFAQGRYPDSRSDDKGCEPEGLTIGRVGNNNLLFVGLERANAVMVFDVTNPRMPKYLQWLDAGVGPEGVLFIPANESPNGKSLLVVSCEVDGTVKVYTTN